MANKKKTALQLEALEKFYAKHKYPSESAIKEITAVLGLSCKQIRGWFIEKRRRDKSIGTIVVSPRVTNREKSTAASSSKIITPIIIQELLPANYILTKIFCTDGPPLGAEFDSPPSRAFSCCASRNLHLACQETQRATKRRKVSKHVLVDPEDSDKSAPVRKHGIGKGLMTAWHVTNPDGGYFPTGVSQVPAPAPPKPSCQNKKPRQFASIMKQRKLENKLKGNKKRPVKTRRVELKKDVLQKPMQKERCKLALEGVASHSHEHLNQFTMLVDDEELELRELQAGPNPLTCEHFAAYGLGGCLLCRDVLSKFPPTSVKMKPPFAMQPWDFSPEMVKKLFKVFHFLYTYSVTVDTCPFTLDEFVQAFHDKDSLLLAKIHVDLLKLLLSDIETELNSGLWPNLSISCKFLALLHSVENQLYVLEFWRKSLNPLTWMEILRQVLLAAGFGSKKGSLRKEPLSKEMILMKKYGLHPGTLKGELFKLLLDQGNNGLRVSELAKSLPITELNLGRTTEELELLMYTTLASDITLFEKISSSAYRLRISSAKEVNDPRSDIEDSGSVHDDYIDCGSSSSSDSECDSRNFSPKRVEHQNSHKSKGNVLAVCTEIDESQPGEVWMLGLMEGEYSDLSIDEKLNILVALLDILSAGSSIRVEDLPRHAVESIPNIRNYGSGGKIKRSSSQKCDMPRPSWVHGKMLDLKEAHTSLEFCPVDSSVSLSKSYSEEDSPSAGRTSKETEAAIGLHPMQSIFLGSDRRYNRYWLFLGPCDEYDSGHRRVYFESSEDGHWEVIDAEEALRALLSVLDDRGTREAHLIESIEKRGASLCQAMSSGMPNDARIRLSQSDHSSLEIVREDSSSPVSDVDNLCLTEVSKDSVSPCGAISLEVGKKGEDQSRKWSHLQELDSWIWNHFYLQLNTVKYSKRSYIDSLTKCETCHDLYWRDEKHCKNCHTTFELDFDLEERYTIHAATCREQGYNDMVLKHKVLPSQLQSLKAAVHAIESVIPEDAMVGAWTESDHRLWVKRLRRTSSLVEILQVVADFAAAIKEDWLYECHIAEGSDTVMREVIACFPSMPQTSSAFALWLMKLDSLIAPYMEKAHSFKNQVIRSKCTGSRATKQKFSCC